MKKNFKKVFWQIYAKVYDHIMLRFLPYGHVLDNVTKSLNPRAGWNVLDAGCGTGNFLYHLLRLRLGVRAVGIDFAAAMLQRAKLKIKKDQAFKEQGIILKEADLNLALPFEDECFEGVVCINVLYAVDNPQSLLKEIHRVLKRDGKFILVTPPFEPKMGPVFKEHVYRLKVKRPRLWPFFLAGQIIFLAPSLFIFLILNYLIKEQRAFHFLKKEELYYMVKSCGFEFLTLEKIYGGQDWILEAVKAVHKQEEIAPVSVTEGGAACRT